MLWTEAETDQRRRADFAIVRQLLIGLELSYGGHGIVTPLAVDFTFEVAFIGERLLNFLVALGVRMRLVGGTPLFSASYPAVGGGCTLVRRR